MLTYDMDARGNLGKYEHLYRCIRADIERGAIAADDRLPSKRALAEHLGVSVITVEQAYAQLVAEGYLSARERSGFYANALPGLPYAMPSVKPVKPVKAGEAKAVESQVGEEPRQVVADFTAPPPFDDRSFAAWVRALRQTASSEDPAEAFMGIPAKGSLRLREAIAGHLRGSRGIDADPDDIVVGAGAQSLYGLLVQLLGRDGVYAVEDPGYPALASIYRAHGACVAHVPLDAHGIDIAGLEASGAGVAHVMPSHQYPTGIVTDAARRYELLGWAVRAAGRYIVEDDYDCELRLVGRPVPALASVDAVGRVVYLNTFARSVSPTLRVAYMVLPAPLSERFNRELGFYASTVSAHAQVALARLIEDGSYERGVNRARAAQRAQRDRLAAAVRAAAPAGTMWLEQADSGLHCVLAVRTGRDEDDMAAECRRNGVLLAPLSGFCVDAGNYRAYTAALGTPLAARFLLSYAGVGEGAMRDALAIVARAAS
ncbi:MAG: PLP-dependent aminotransferase family protein [Eggerthellaceae bacterium]|nr:PLP-dependent aminotransferase family protein [Eggerthellaceae bacterium]